MTIEDHNKRVAEAKASYKNTIAGINREYAQSLSYVLGDIVKTTKGTFKISDFKYVEGSLLFTGIPYKGVFRKSKAKRFSDTFRKKDIQKVLLHRVS